jgi:hypothetical protein
MLTSLKINTSRSFSQSLILKKVFKCFVYQTLNPSICFTKKNILKINTISIFFIKVQLKP